MYLAILQAISDGFDECIVLMKISLTAAVALLIFPGKDVRNKKKEVLPSMRSVRSLLVDNICICLRPLSLSSENSTGILAAPWRGLSRPETVVSVFL